MDVGALIGEPMPNGGGFPGMGVTLIADADLPSSRRSFLKAWDPIGQKEAWNIELPGDWPGGVLATAGDLVFQGRIDGEFVAYDAGTGKRVWSFKAPSPIVAAPVSYRVNGRQYVTVLTGSGSQGGGIFATGNAAYRTDYRLPRHVLTFALGGTDRLPPFAMPELVAPDDPDFTLDGDRVKQGAMTYAMNACLVCHGMNAIGGGAAPDLRYSPVIVSKEGFEAVVRDGTLKHNGMPAYQALSVAELEDIRYYLRAAARAAVRQGAGAPGPTPRPEAARQQGVSGGI